MPLAISDAENALLSSEFQFQEFVSHFETEWYAPIRRTMLAVVLASLPPEALGELVQRKPAAMRVILSDLVR